MVELLKVVLPACTGFMAHKTANGAAQLDQNPVVSGAFLHATIHCFFTRSSNADAGECWCSSSSSSMAASRRNSSNKLLDAGSASTSRRLRSSGCSGGGGGGSAASAFDGAADSPTLLGDIPLDNEPGSGGGGESK